MAQLKPYETQVVLPNTRVLKRMAKRFGITIDFLVNGRTAQKAESAIADTKLLDLIKQVE